MNDEQKQETIADIVAQIRAAAYIQNADTPRSVLYLADRIEAAWKREAKAIATENAVLPAVCITKSVGNAAAMREAVKCVKEIAIREWNSFRETASMKEMHDICEAALSEPPRNCDVMDWRTAWAKWRTENHPQKPVGYSECYESTTMFMDWYMGTAELKGGSDGK